MPDHAAIAICGAGPVGLALGALLVQGGVDAQHIVLLDAKPLEQAQQDPRSIALSFGSRQLLEKLGAWPVQANPIHQIHVSRRGHFGRTLIGRDEFGVEALGYVTRYGRLVEALSRVTHSAGIAVMRPAAVGVVAENAEGVTLTLTDGRSITAGLLVQAEGGLFNQQGQRKQHRDYDQVAIVAQVTASAPLPLRAFERFTEEGPLALLPQDDGYALVWCMRPASAERLLALGDAEFLSELGSVFGTRVGRFSAAGPRFSYPLGLNAEPAVTDRTIAIGNAAQTLHPVAGQGLNLGLRDAQVLARRLAQSLTPPVLQDYAADRRADRSSTIRLTDTMARIFASAPDGALTQGLLGGALGLVDTFTPAKRLLAEQMMYGRR